MYVTFQFGYLVSGGGLVTSRNMVVTMKPAQPLDGVRDERWEQVGERVHVGVHHVGTFGLQLLKF